jgi:hypothetical protein
MLKRAYPVPAIDVRTLENTADVLIAAPQRRKAIIYISPGVTADHESVATPTLAAPGKLMVMREQYASVISRLPEMYRRLQRANVTIYGIDPTGLGGMENYVMQRAAGLRPLREAKAPFSLSANWLDPPGPPMPMDVARRVSQLTLDFLRTAAENTGGLTITNTNEFESGMTRIFEENSSYYLLGFAPPPGRRPGSLHRLEVRVNRQDVRVRARTGYATPSPDPPAAPPTGADDAAAPPSRVVTSAIASPVPAGDLPLRVAVAPFATPGSSNATVAIALGVRAPDAPDANDASTQTFEVQVRAFTPDGGARGNLQGRGRITLRPPVIAKGDALDLLTKIELPPGRYELRLGAALDPLGLAGSVFTDVVVPDFEDDRLSMSGVLFETNPPAQAGPLDALTSIVPIVPTARREFSVQEAVAAFLRVYQGGDHALEAATVQISVQDGHDRIVYNYRHPLPVSRFDAATRHADVRFELPLRAMVPGSHLLTFEARLGPHTVRRQVRFTFR